MSKRDTLVGATHFGKSVWSSLCSSAQLQVGAGRADLSGQGEHLTISGWPGRVLGGSGNRVAEQGVMAAGRQSSKS